MIPSFFKIKVFQTIESTHQYCHDMLMNGVALHGQVIQARLQTNGKGSKGRLWKQPRGDQLAMTMVVDVSRSLSTRDASDIMHSDESDLAMYGKTVNRIYSQLSYVVSVAAGLAILKLNPGANLSFKWLNDILLNEKKVGGVLATLVSLHSKSFAILSLGMNVEHAPIIEKSVGNSAAKFGLTCLRDEGIDVSSDIIRDEFLAIFAELYNKWRQNGLADIIAHWRSRDILIGKRIEILVKSCSDAGADSRLITGVYSGMLDNGAILIKRDGADDIELYAGDIKAIF